MNKEHCTPVQGMPGVWIHDNGDRIVLIVERMGPSVEVAIDLTVREVIVYNGGGEDPRFYAGYIKFREGTK